MNELLPILIISLTSTVFFFYKVIKGVRMHIGYRFGKKSNAEIVKAEWVDAPPAKFSSLYPKKQLKVCYRFNLGDDLYEKEDYDIHFRYRYLTDKVILKKGQSITIYIPKNNNPDRVTINKSEDTILPIIGFGFLGLISTGIAFLVLYNWK